MSKEILGQAIKLLREFDFELDRANREYRYKMSKCKLCSSLDQVYYDKYSECLSLNNTKKAEIKKVISLLKGGK